MSLLKPWTAYFERSYEAVFGVVHRPSFEARLRAHMAQESPTKNEDASWFAMRNMVYALGCRSLMATDSSLSFLQAGKRSRAFFQNALSVIGEMILGRSGFTAVQALVLMVRLSDPPGNPKHSHRVAVGIFRRRSRKSRRRIPISYQRRSTRFGERIASGKFPIVESTGGGYVDSKLVMVGGVLFGETDRAKERETIDH